MPPNGPTLPQTLADWRNGDQDAGNRLFAAAYQELRRLAAWHLQRERPGHTLQATALVNELYLKLFGGEPVDWRDRAHFFAVAAQQIRHLLIDYARAALAEKRPRNAASWSPPGPEHHPRRPASTPWAIGSPSL